MAEVTVAFTRSDLVALKETLEVTSLFEGRAELRDAVNAELWRGGRPEPLRLEDRLLSHLARSVIGVDPVSMSLRAKITRALRSSTQTP